MFVLNRMACRGSRAVITVKGRENWGKNEVAQMQEAGGRVLGRAFPVSPGMKLELPRVLRRSGLRLSLPPPPTCF